MTPKPATAPSRKALRWQDHKERTRRDLLASARRLFAERGYQATSEGIHEFGMHHRDMMALVMASQGDLDIPADGPQRPLIDFEDTLAGVLRERYALPAEDQITPAVWARACIGALRTAIDVSARNARAEVPPAGAPGDTLRACFAALQRGQ